MNDIAPWSPYLARTSLPSAGRIALTAAFADVIYVRCGFEAHELPEIFHAPADDGENDACRDIVRLNVEHTAEQFIRGRIPTFARPLDGGIITPLDPSLWEIDDPLRRFATGAFNLTQWSDPNAELSHRLFVDSATYNRWLMLQRQLGPLSSSEIESVLDPQVRAVRSTAVTNTVCTSDQGGFNESHPSRNSTYCFEERSDTISLAEVEKRTSLKRSTIYSYMGNRKFPQNFQLTDNRVGWSAAEIDKWIAERAANRKH